MSPADAFFTVAGFVAVRNILTWRPARVSPRVATAALAAAALVSGTWAARVVGTHLNLGTGAYVERNGWVYADSALADEGVTLTDAEKVLLRTLRDDAIFVHPPPPPLAPPLRALWGSQ